MADLTTSNFEVEDFWYEGDRFGKATVLCKLVKITSGIAGGTSNKIPASVFGMNKIYEAKACAGNSSNDCYIASPSYDQETLYLYDMSTSGDTARGDPADVDFAGVTMRILVKGKVA